MMEFAEQEVVNLRLSSMGDCSRLRYRFSTEQVKKDLAPFEGQWKQYNPSKPYIDRRGLSVTSLDGGMSGSPDLDSLLEHFRRTGVRHHESDFKAWTPVANGLTEIKEVLEYFNPVGRSHFLELNPGGHFPPHRDPDQGCFRLISLVSASSNLDYVFLVEDKKIHFDPGWLYYLNTQKVHSLFSFVPGVRFLVLNIPSTRENLNRVSRVLFPT